MDPVTITIILSAALAVSEGLSMIPAVKANGIFQCIWNVLKMIAGSAKKKEE